MEEPGFGRYEVVERLVVRAASELFVVKVFGEHGFKRHVVLERLRDDAHAASFIADAKLSAMLSHSKIVQTLELGRVGDAPFVATEYVDGIDLLGLLQELAKRKRSIEPALALWIAQELLDALDYAHTLVDDSGRPMQLVHGRLSPSKVLLGNAGEVKLRDFGVARRFDLDHSGNDYSHMSPELVTEQPIDARSDVFGVGVLLAEMLMGRRLFAAINEFDVLLMVRDGRVQRFDAEVARLDGELVSILRKALENKPEDRWPNAAAFRDAIDAWLFAHRCQGMKQQLAALAHEVRADVDRWRREGTNATPEFDAVEPPEKRWTRPGIHNPLVRTVAIPPVAKGSTPIPLDKPDHARGTVEPKRELEELDIDLSDDLEPNTERRPADSFKVNFKRADDFDIDVDRGADDELAIDIAQGTDQPVARSVGKPLAKPDVREERPRYQIDPIPPLLKPRTPEQPQVNEPARASAKTPPRGQPTVQAKSGLGASLESLLPERPAPESKPARQPLTAEQLAKAGQPVPPKLAKLERAADDGGDFARTPPLRVLFSLMRTRATGLLAVTLGSVRKDVYVRDGQLGGVWSNDPEDLFGKFLVSQRVLSEGELAMALATMSHYGGKIGDTLVGLNLLRRVEVFRHLTRHARTRVVDICTWTEGRYAWYAGKEDPREAFPLEAEGYTMLGEGLLAIRPTTIDTWLARNRETRLVVTKAHRVALDSFGVKGAENVFDLIDGVRTVGAIVDRHTDRAQATRLLYLFVACDLVRLG